MLLALVVCFPRQHDTIIRSVLLGFIFASIGLSPYVNSREALPTKCQSRSRRQGVSLKFLHERRQLYEFRISHTMEYLVLSVSASISGCIEGHGFTATRNVEMDSRVGVALLLRGTNPSGSFMPQSYRECTVTYLVRNSFTSGRRAFAQASSSSALPSLEHRLHNLHSLTIQAAYLLSYGVRGRIYHHLMMFRNGSGLERCCFWRKGYVQPLVCHTARLLISSWV